MRDFRYHHPATLAAALEIHNDSADPRYLAGGQTLIPVLKLRLDAPSDLIDLSGVPGVAGIAEDDGAISVGAMTRHADVAASQLVRTRMPAVAALAGAIGDPLVRNMGTIGGSLANNDPAADWPAAVMGLDATVHTDRRAIAADDFFTGMFETALEEGELITRITFPVPEKAGYARFPNPASRYPLVGVFTARTSTGVRVAVTGAAPSIFRVSEMEQALEGGYEASRLRSITVDPEDLNGDIHASSEYRAHLIRIMAQRAVVGGP